MLSFVGNIKDIFFVKYVHHIYAFKSLYLMSNILQFNENVMPLEYLFLVT